LAGHPLKDKRVRIEVADVSIAIRTRRNALDAILLDVDNGPSGFTTSENSRLYDDRGLADIHEALKPGGVLAVWSARDDRKFVQRLRYGRFVVEVERVRGRLKKGGPHHTIFRAQKSI
jgi:spermidine synthase